MSAIRFGTAGLSESYAARGYKNIRKVPQYLASFGLDAFEYQCGRGVRMAQDTADILARDGREAGIVYSLHAPYYISMASMEEEKRLASIRYMLQSAAAVRMLGGRRVIFHPGSAGKQSREEAMQKTCRTLQQMLDALDEDGFGEIVPCPETMGKNAQIGTLDEVLALCALDRRVIPCLDLGHLNARTQGAIKTRQDYADILDKLEDALGDERARDFHVHFSKIEYTGGGERRHLTFADTTYGPDYEPFLELCCQRGLTPTIICESAGTQAEDAQAMMLYYRGLAGQGAGGENGAE